MTPAFVITADGADVTGAIAARLHSLRLTDRQAMEADELEVTIDDTNGALALPRTRATLRLSLGFKGGALVDKGSFIVDEVGHVGPPDRIRIRARAAAFVGTLKDQRDLSYHSTTIGAIVRAIAERNGLVPAIAGDFDAIAVPHVDQTTESDAHFLTRIGRDHGAVATVKDGRLLFIREGRPVTAGGRPIPTATITRTQGDRHRYQEAERDGTVKAVRARYRDYDQNLTLTTTAGDVDAESVKTLKRDFASKAEADAAVKAELERINRAKRTFSLDLAIGRPDLTVNQPITLSGWRAEIDGANWITRQLEHLVGDKGYVTRMEAGTIA